MTSDAGIRVILLGAGATSGPVDDGKYATEEEYWNARAVDVLAKNGPDDASECTRLITNGADVNIKGSMDETPLMTTARNNRPNICRVLLERGADVRCVNKEGETALSLAESDEIKALLRAAGAE